METRCDSINKCKFQKIESHVDRISDLPDELISYILSNLTTKDAVRTSVLSRIWEHKWTSIYNIDIRDDEGHYGLYEDVFTRFITFVDDILFSHKSAIRSFRLVCERKYDAYHLAKWISKVLKRHVQYMQLTAPNCGTVDLPRCLASCTSLIKLNIFSSCTLRVPTANCFQNLKSLGLHDANIINQQSSNESPLLLSFPVLEDLELRNCIWSNASFVEIKAPELLIFNSTLNNDCQIKIYGTKLKRFVSAGDLLALFDMYTPSVSLVGLINEIDFQSHGTRPYTLLKSFPFLSNLIITNSNRKALVQSIPETAPLFGCLQQLCMVDKVEVEELMGFLKLTPILKVLILKLSSSYTYAGEQVKILPACMISRLQTVALFGFSGTQVHMAIVKFFLENAKALEKFLVPDSCTEPMFTSLRSTISKSSNCGLYRRTPYRIIFSREVPRAGE